MIANDDEHLVDRALRGDAGATRVLVDRLLPVVEARVVRALGRHRGREAIAQVAPDLTQHVFLMLFENDGRRLRAWRADRGASLATFVALVAEREVIAVLRRTRRNPWTEAPTDDEELDAHAGAAIDDAEGALADRDLLDAVLDRALTGLDDRGLVLFQRLVVDEADCVVVAREMRTSVAALYMWKSRFGKRMRAIAAEMGHEPARASVPSIGLQPAWRGR